MEQVKILTLFFILLIIGLIKAEETKSERNAKLDLEPSASGRFLDLSSLFYNKYPSYGTRPYYGGGGSGYYPSSGYYPNSGYNPSGGYYPSVGSYPTGGSGYYPGAGYPSGGGYYPPGTNFLGGGYGGYGGYGGNGGLNSYLGYYDRGYYGRRNLGFGYYPHTNSLGFVRGKYSLPGYVSGYRGYD